MNKTILLNTKSIIASERELLSAMENGNIKVLENLLHKDLLFITPDGQTISKKMDIEAYRSKKMVIDKIKSS